jgi:hypothetical protein
MQALATFPAKISAANLKEVGKLKGVGKGSLDKVGLLCYMLCYCYVSCFDCFPRSSLKETTSCCIVP